MSRSWTRSNPQWQALTPFQRVAVMSLMEKDGKGTGQNEAAAMINRAQKAGQDYGEHVSGRIYQPTFEPAQERRLNSILNSPSFNDHVAWVERYARGEIEDPTGGATHFLAPERTMLALERSNPAKYKNWGPRGANWTGFDPSTGAYRGVTHRNESHAFLAPEGAFSAYKGTPGAQPVQVASAPQQGLPGSPSGPAPVRSAPIPPQAPQSVAQAPQAPAAPFSSAPPTTPPAAQPEAGSNPLSGMFASLAKGGEQQQPKQDPTNYALIQRVMDDEQRRRSQTFDFSQMYG
jgi:hypothetical protein